ncbi:MAG: tryptophan synthase subunit alpha [Gammaproteobacteria bacterium]|nr:tryptophan synthase subunit alpha [Gammaproteobacteria bacterium]
MIKTLFAKNNTLFIPFVMSGFPSVSISREAILGLAQLGADLIEVGIPFSDPIADGPINQCAASIAIHNHVTVKTVLDEIKSIRALNCQTPIMLFSYLNPILAYGYKNFLDDAKKVGADGILILDLPLEMGHDIYSYAKKIGLSFALLASPTTSVTRLNYYHALAPDFIYYIVRLGVTGIQDQLPNDLEEKLLSLKTFVPKIPIVAGFGIASIQDAKKVGAVADGVVVGSQLMDILDKQGLGHMLAFAKQLLNTIGH